MMELVLMNMSDHNSNSTVAMMLANLRHVGDKWSTMRTNRLCIQPRKDVFPRAVHSLHLHANPQA